MKVYVRFALQIKLKQFAFLVGIDAYAWNVERRKSKIVQYAVRL